MNTVLKFEKNLDVNRIHFKRTISLNQHMVEVIYNGKTYLVIDFFEDFAMVNNELKVANPKVDLFEFLHYIQYQCNKYDTLYRLTQDIKFLLRDIKRNDCCPTFFDNKADMYLFELNGSVLFMMEHYKEPKNLQNFKFFFIYEQKEYYKESFFECSPELFNVSNDMLVNMYEVISSYPIMNDEKKLFCEKFEEVFLKSI